MVRKSRGSNYFNTIFFYFTLSCQKLNIYSLSSFVMPLIWLPSFITDYISWTMF